VSFLEGRPTFQRPPAAAYQSQEIYQGVFTARQCARIVELGLSLPASDAALEAEGGDEITADGIRRSRTAWIAPDADTEWIFEKLGRIVQRANRRYRFDLTGFGEDLQFTTYDQPGAFYTWHQDGLDGTVGTRKLSVVVQLSDPDDYRGAELQFFDVIEDLADYDLDEFTTAVRPQGTVVVFPSFEYHRVLPLRSGTRHSLVAWVSGPPFR
jgi:PKHD-type hydroxylase